MCRRYGRDYRCAFRLVKLCANNTVGSNHPQVLLLVLSLTAIVSLEDLQNNISNTVSLPVWGREVYRSNL